MDDPNKHKFKVLPPKISNPPEDRIRFRKKQGNGDDDELDNPNSYHKSTSKPQKRFIKVKRSTKRKDSSNNQKIEMRTNKNPSNSDKQGKKFDYEKFNRKTRKNDLRYFHTPEDVTKIVFDLITEITSLQDEISKLSEKVSKKEKKFDDDQELLIQFKRRNNIQEESISPRHQKRTLDSSYEQERVYTLTKYLNQLQIQMDQLDERYEKDKDYFTNNTLDHLKIDVCMLNHDINEVQTQLDEDQSLLELGQNELQSESLAKGIRIYEKQQKKIGRMKSKLNSLFDEERELMEQRNQLKIYGKTTTNNKSKVDKLKQKYNSLLTTRKNKEQQLESKKQAEEAKQKQKKSAKKPNQVTKKPNAKSENAGKTFDFISALDHDSQAEIPDNESNSSENHNNASQDLHNETKQSSTELNQSHSDDSNKSDINNDTNQSHNDNSNENNENDDNHNSDDNDNPNDNENDNSSNDDNHNSDDNSDDDHNENNSNKDNENNSDNDSNKDNNDSDNDNNDDNNDSDSDNNDDNLDGSGFDDDKSKQSDSNDNDFDSKSQLKSTGGNFNQSKQSDTNLDDDFEQSDKNEGSLMQMGKNVIDTLVNAKETNANDASDDFNDDFGKMHKDYVQMQANIINQLNAADVGNDGEDDMEFDSEADKTKQNSLNNSDDVPNAGLSHTVKSKESANQLCDDDDDDIISGSMASMNSTLSASIRNAKELTDKLTH